MLFHVITTGSCCSAATIMFITPLSSLLQAGRTVFIYFIYLIYSDENWKTASGQNSVAVAVFWSTLVTKPLLKIYVEFSALSFDILNPKRPRSKVIFNFIFTFRPRFVDTSFLYTIIFDVHSDFLSSIAFADYLGHPFSLIIF